MASQHHGHVFDPSILRAYDIRGVFGKTLSAADAYALGRAFATWVNQDAERLALGRRARIVVGRDGRVSSQDLEEALVEGLCEGGVDALRIGLGPSPMLYFAEASTEQVEGGIQVTGSHNPADHNGFKIVLGGRPFFGPQLLRLGEIAARAEWSSGCGIQVRMDVAAAYAEALLGALAGVEGHRHSSLRVGWDAGNGACGPVLEALTGHLPGQHLLLFSEVDGSFPNHHPDPTVEENLSDLRRLVMAKKLDFGVAFDGDGDRIGVIDAFGRVIWGDQLLALFAGQVLEDIPGASVVGDVKMSQATFEAIEQAGGVAVMAPSGHSFIKSRMKETGAVLGGEMSGHVFFADRWFGFDDGIYAALRLLALCAKTGRTVAQLYESLPQTYATPELRFPVSARRRASVVADIAERVRNQSGEVVTIDGLRVTTPDGWWLLRASNTQDMLTVRAEGSSPAARDRLLAEIDAHLEACGIIRRQP